MTFNTSARANGMGNAGSAVTWGTDTNHWANPAMLAYRPGVNYLSFRSELAEGLADDTGLTNKELTLGAYGVTFLLATGPLEGNFLDMGEKMGTDESGNPTGTFDSYMEAKSWGLGVDMVQVLDQIRGVGEQGWSRYASVAVGFKRIEFQDMLSPDDPLLTGDGSGVGTATDKGFVIRATPLRIEALGSQPDKALVGLTGGVAYGYSLHADTNDFIYHTGADQGDPFPRAFFTGWSGYVALTLAPAAKARPTSDFGRLMIEAIDPLVSFTVCSQLIEPGYIWTGQEYEYEHDTSGGWDETGSGWELGLANIFYLRSGHTEALYANLDGDTSGWGINLQVGRMGGFRYDQASVPQATGVPNVERKGWSVWVDPLAIVRR